MTTMSICPWFFFVQFQIFIHNNNKTSSRPLEHSSRLKKRLLFLLHTSHSFDNLSSSRRTTCGYFSLSYSIILSFLLSRNLEKWAKIGKERKEPFRMLKNKTKRIHIGYYYFCTFKVYTNIPRSNKFGFMDARKGDKKTCLQTFVENIFYPVLH